MYRSKVFIIVVKHNILTGWLKKTCFCVLAGNPVKIFLKIIWRYPLIEYTLFSFYKPNSIFKTKGTFYGNKFSKSNFFIGKDYWFFKIVFNKLFHFKQTNHKDKQISKLLFWYYTDQNINRHCQPPFYRCNRLKRLFL